MTKAYVLDGKAIADGVIDKVARETRALAARGVKPGLAVVLVGADPASQVYVGAKGKAAEACGFHSVQHTLPADTGEAELLALVASLNADPAVHGILVQLPLPKAVNAARVLEAVDPAQGRRRFPSDQCRSAFDRRDEQGYHSLHAGGRDDHARQGLRSARRDPRRQGGCRHRALQHRRQADGATAARRAIAR